MSDMECDSNKSSPGKPSGSARLYRQASMPSLVSPSISEPSHARLLTCEQPICVDGLAHRRINYFSFSHARQLRCPYPNVASITWRRLGKLQIRARFPGVRVLILYRATQHPPGLRHLNTKIHGVMVKARRQSMLPTPKPLATMLHLVVVVARRSRSRQVKGHSGNERGLGTVLMLQDDLIPTIKGLKVH